jgi:hypothetical protein
MIPADSEVGWKAQECPALPLNPRPSSPLRLSPRPRARRRVSGRTGGSRLPEPRDLCPSVFPTYDLATTACRKRYCGVSEGRCSRKNDFLKGGGPRLTRDFARERCPLRGRFQRGFSWVSCPIPCTGRASVLPPPVCPYEGSGGPPKPTQSAIGEGWPHEPVGTFLLFPRTRTCTRPSGRSPDECFRASENTGLDRSLALPVQRLVVHAPIGVQRTPIPTLTPMTRRALDAVFPGTCALESDPCHPKRCFSADFPCALARNVMRHLDLGSGILHRAASLRLWRRHAVY